MSIAHKVIEAHRTSDVLIAENVDFDGLLLTDYVLKGLKNAGFRKPSPIQLKAIPLGRCGLDLVVQAKSGTGKTCVFAVIALESLLLDSSAVQVLVLAPTREIADQVWDVISKIGASIPSLRCQLFIGGMPLSADKKKAKVCHIAVGTPGRIKQLIEDGILKTTSIRLFILDEADKLLEESFQEQINWIYSALPENKQMLALSATYPEYLAQHLTQYMRNPTFIRLSKSDPALLGIKQYYKMVDFHSMAKQQFDNKTKAVMELLSNISFQQCLVFSNLQNRAHNLSDELLSQGWPTACIAGFLDQRDRNEAMAKLKTYKCRVLITTDLTARGIDAEKVNLIINLDVPKDHETYLHRIGRAGRFGSFGAAITLVSNGEEEKLLKILEYKCNTWIYPLPDPVPVDLVKINLPYKPKDVVITEQIITRPDLSQSETHKCEDQILLDNEEVDRSSAQESEVLIHLPSNDSTPNPNQLDMPATVCDKLEPDQLYDAYFNANDNVPINNRDDSVTPTVLVDKTFHLSLNSNVHLDKAFKIFVHADVQSSETEDKSGGHENYSKSAHSDTALRTALVPAGAKLKQNKTNINHKVQDDDELFVGSRNDSSDVSLSRRNKLKKNVLNGRKTEDEDQNYVKSDGYDSFDQLFVSGEKSNNEQNRIRVDVSVPENWKLKCRTKQNTNVKDQISHNSDFISDELYDEENKDSNNLTNNSTENSKDKYKKKKQRSDDPNWRRVEKAEMVWRKDQDHTEPKTLHDSPARSSRSGCVLKIPSYQECIGYERVDCNITYTSAVESLDRFKQQGKLPEEKISLIDLIKTKITDSGKTEDKDLNALVSQHLNKFHREFNEKPEPDKSLSQRLPPSDLALKSVLKAPGKTRDKNMKNNPDSYDKNKIVSVTFSKTNQYVMSGLEQSSGQTDNLIYSDAMVQNLANLKLCGKHCPGDSSESQEGYESDSSSSFSSLYEKDVYKNSYAAEAERLQNKHEPGSSCNGEQVSEVSCDLEQKNSHSTFWSIGPYTDPKHPYHEDNLLMRAGDDGRGTVSRTEGSPNGIFSSHLISHSADAGQNTTRRQVHYPYGENPIIYPCGENPDQYSDQENSNQYSDQENSSEYSTQENADELSAQQNPDEFSDEENSEQYPHQECSEQFSPQEIQDQTSSGENQCQENQDHFSPEEESFINQGKLPSSENQFSEVHYPYGEHPVMSSEEKSLCAEDELFYFKSVPPFRDPSYENMQQELNPYHQWDPNSPYTLSSQWVHYPPHPGLPLPNPYPGHGRFHYSPQNSFPTYPVQPDIMCNYIPPQPGYAFPQEPLPRMSQQYEKVHQMLIQKQKEYIKHMSHW